MPTVMKDFGRANGQKGGTYGQYLADFDFEAHDGIGEITMTKYLTEAKIFPGLMEAFAFYKTVPKCKPIREDGQPNRPLTATNWQFEPIE